MDHLPHFRREIRAFAAAARRAAADAPVVPSCPDWSVTDLVAHLGGVHRFVSRVVEDRLAEPPDTTDRAFLRLPAGSERRPASLEDGPHRGPVPAGLIEWFEEGAAELAEHFRETGPDEPVWSWTRERSTGFWLWVQSVEAALHRWDAENAIGAAAPLDADHAADAIGRHLGVVAPAWRARAQAPAGSGERLRFRRTDGPGEWTVSFEGDAILPAEGPCDAELSGTASDLLLFLWHRLPADACQGNSS
ncbi:maleylpyruvate isomerase family mycothiol-dependent enzyme, partial [Streptomyces sp. AV19]|uniref:maleylpyruvate isomerase family mycothiol-dependent enzyme n=1 Tax=Streptomyces sp. AV19 TaxID=2793068 RepID=UPI0018FE9144